MLENLEKELNIRREENFDLQQKLEMLQNDQREIEKNRTQTVKTLKDKIRESEREINQLSHRDERDTKSKLRVRPKSSVNLNKQANKSAIILNTIRNDVKEISSFITVNLFLSNVLKLYKKRDREDPLSGRLTKRKEYGLKTSSNPLSLNF